MKFLGRWIVWFTKPRNLVTKRTKFFFRGCWLTSETGAKGRKIFRDELGCWVRNILRIKILIFQFLLIFSSLEEYSNIFRKSFDIYSKIYTTNLHFSNNYSLLHFFLISLFIFFIIFSAKLQLAKYLKRHLIQLFEKHNSPTSNINQEFNPLFFAHTS